jgi:branched-chain amino acid aminotransferase
MKSWSNGSVIEGKRQIDSFNYSLHYASPVVWEGIRSYKQADGTTKIWKLEEHIQRLFDSAKIIGFEIPYTVPQIIQACKDIVEANGGGDLYLRPIAFNNVDAEGILSSGNAICVDIYAKPVPDLHGKSDKGIKMVISNLVRGYPQFNMQAKTAANYQFVQMAKPYLNTEIKDIFLLDNNGYVVEATVANFWVFKGDVAMTPPNNGSILPGVTRRCIADILRDNALMFTKYKKAPIVIEKNITRGDLYTADCVILCGTYAEVVNVIEIDGRKIGTPDTHFYYKMLKAEYTNLVRGRNG